MTGAILSLLVAAVASIVTWAAVTAFGGDSKMWMPACALVGFLAYEVFTSTMK